MYRVSGKQLAALAIFSALFAGVIVACAQKAIERATNVAFETTAVADPTAASEEQNNIDIYRNVSPGVVHITSRTYVQGFFGIFPEEGSGSGSIIDKDGHILTNYHVVQNASRLDVQIEGERHSARIVGTDPDNDLAVIKVNAPAASLKPVPLGKSKGLQVGQKVLAIGNPFGLERTLTTGIISGLERPIREPGGRTIEGAIQTDASINPGNSGGPLLNARGEMIGINTAIYSPSGGSVGIGFAVPVDTAARIIPELIARGYVARGWLGISMLELNRRTARELQLPVEQGIIVAGVYRGSGAASAGLRSWVISRSVFGGGMIEEVGDIILAVDGQDVATTEQLHNALKDKRPGETVRLVVLRQGRRLTVPVQLTERPQGAR